MSSLQELEAAAINVIRILKSVPEFQNDTIAVIGGMALWKYIPNGRTTQDVDFTISVYNAPQSVKEKLLRLPGSPFVQRSQFFYFVNQNGREIQIDMVAQVYIPFLPAALTKIKDVPSNTVPYISVVDLICFKVFSCGLRPDVGKRRRDATDAEALLSRVAATSPLNLSAPRKQQLEPCIDDVVKYGGKSREWWLQRLGLPSR